MINRLFQKILDRFMNPRCPECGSRDTAMSFTVGFEDRDSAYIYQCKHCQHSFEERKL